MLAVVECRQGLFSEELDFPDLRVKILRKAQSFMFLKLAFERVRKHEIILEDLFGPFTITSSERVGILIIHGRRALG